MNDETVPSQVMPGPQQKANSATKKPHTAVLYFHGMGNQKRYEEISRLIDCLDSYAHQSPAISERMKWVRPEIELPRGPIKKDVTSIKASRELNGKTVTAKFYEVYWAPLLAGGVPSLKVLQWLLKQVPHPISAMRTGWRLRARLRRMTLIGLSEKWSVPLRKYLSVEAKDFTHLLFLYDDFEGEEARRFSKGKSDFRSFLKFLREGAGKRGRLLYEVRLAKVWWLCYQMQEMWHLFLLVTVALTAALGALAATLLVAATLKKVSGLNVLPSALQHSKLLQASSRNIVGILGALASLLGIRKFLTDFLGDVHVWTTYEETDEKYKKREEILTAATDMFRHVLEDPLCERCVVVAHSLGTTVALDALLELYRYNRPRLNGDTLPLKKIDLFITMGSPIDKVHYFFESVAGKYHRYNRLVEDLRGDLGTPPFADNRKRQIHWINFWDQADLVSGALKSPSSRKLVALRVDNYEVASYGFPVPGKSHSGYFEHRDVVRILSEGIFEGKYTYRNLPLLPKAGYDYDSQLVGRNGGGLWTTRIYQLLALLLPWLVAAAAAVSLAKASGRSFYLEVTICVIVLVLLIGYLCGRPWRHRVPIF